MNCEQVFNDLVIFVSLSISNIDTRVSGKKSFKSFSHACVLQINFGILRNIVSNGWRIQTKGKSFVTFSLVSCDNKILKTNSSVYAVQ